ncbi:hypothetical protein [Timonella senegalensis]|uniref:hypothetical protein n=1 Tax=Timonella senegalensis TaxID=1465825 RepID=UPI0028A6D7F1|nr:hypothetical protein [Timonella senegalensis]
MIIELPDDAYTYVSLHARSRAHVKDMQAQFPDAKWKNKLIRRQVGTGRFPVVEAQIGKTNITIYPRTEAVDA